MINHHIMMGSTMAQKTLAANRPLDSLAKKADTSEIIYNDKTNMIAIMEAILFFINGYTFHFIKIVAVKQRTVI